jgi:hypothetical protein
MDITRYCEVSPDEEQKLQPFMLFDLSKVKRAGQLVPIMKYLSWRFLEFSDLNERFRFCDGIGMDRINGKLGIHKKEEYLEMYANVIVMLFRDERGNKMLEGLYSFVEANFREFKTAPAEPCSICYQSLSGSRPRIMLNCNHGFHRDCIDRWTTIQQQQSMTPTCPLCRNPII